jgi:hypothetical protein
MSLEFIDNPQLLIKNKVQRFVKELSSHPLRWALFKTSPEKSQYWANRFSMEVSQLKKRFPDIDWHRAETEDAHQIVAWYQPEEEN